MEARTFGRFTLTTKLGEGGFGEVYEARDPRLGRAVALKILKHDPALLNEKRFQREAEALARIVHPNIVRIHETGSVQEGRYMVLELVPGRPLTALLHDGTPRERLLDLLVQVARGIDAAHEAGVIHRDLKPANVVVDDEGHARVVDFGLAGVEDASVALTQTGSLLGTAAYMSPEAAAGRNELVGPWSDVFSLGVILFEALAGELPKPEIGFLDYLRFLRSTETFPAPSGRAPGISPVLDAVCARALEKDVHRRFRSAASFAEALREACASRHRTRSRRWAIPMAIGLTLVVLAGVRAFSVPPLAPSDALEAPRVPAHPPTTPRERPQLSPANGAKLLADPACVGSERQRAEDGLRGDPALRDRALGARALALATRSYERLLECDVEGAAADASEATTIRPDLGKACLVQAEIDRYWYHRLDYDHDPRRVADHHHLEAEAEALRRRGPQLIGGTEAIEEYERGSAAEADSWAFALRASNPDGAIRWATCAIVKSPSLVRPWITRATVYLARNDPERALADARGLLERSPRCSDAYVISACVDRMRGDHRRAVEEATHALDVASFTEDRSWGPYRALEIRGWSRLALGQVDEAERDARQAMALAERQHDPAPAWTEQLLRAAGKSR
jgi:hypothetical protein